MTARRACRGAMPASSNRSPTAAKRLLRMTCSSENRFDTARDAPPLIGQMFEPTPPLRGDRVVHARPPLYGTPTPFDEPALLQRMQRRIQDAFADTDGLAREYANGTGELITVHFARREQLQDQELRNAGHEGGGGRSHSGRLYAQV